MLPLWRDWVRDAWNPSVFFFFSFNNDGLMVILLFILRERERESVSEHKPGRDRERRKERILGRLCVDSAEPNAGLEPTNSEIMT